MHRVRAYTFDFCEYNALILFIHGHVSVMISDRTGRVVVFIASVRNYTHLYFTAISPASNADSDTMQ